MLNQHSLEEKLNGINWQDREEVIRLAKSDIEIFKYIYEKIEEQNEVERQAKAKEIKDPQMSSIFHDLMRDGIAVWPGMYSDPQFLESARNYVHEATNFGRELIAANPGKKDVPHEGVLYSTSEPLNRQIAPVDFPIYGRTRAMWDTTKKGVGHPTAMQVAEDPRINSLLSAYSGRPPTALYVIAEELVPSFYGQEWHLDKWHEQVKAMILLTDCTIMNGALRFVKKTHRNRSKRIWKMLHDSYSLGASYCCTSDLAIIEDEEEVYWGTGKAGDCFFFDATSLHAGTQCMEQERLNYIFYPISNSLKSQTLQNILGE